MRRQSGLSSIEVMACRLFWHKFYWMVYNKLFFVQNALWIVVHKMVANLFRFLNILIVTNDSFMYYVVGSLLVSVFLSVSVCVFVCLCRFVSHCVCVCVCLWVYLTLSLCIYICSNYLGWPVIDPLHKSHNAPVSSPTVHQFETKIFVHISVEKWCTSLQTPVAWQH